MEKHTETGDFSLTSIAAGARKKIETDLGPRPVVVHEPLACVLADYCAAKGIDQEQLLRELGTDPQHPLSHESFRKLAMVTVNVSALVQVLLGGLAEDEEPFRQKGA